MAQIRASSIATFVDPVTRVQHVESRVRFSVSDTEAESARALTTTLEASMDATIRVWAKTHGLTIAPELMTSTFGEVMDSELQLFTEQLTRKKREP